MISGYISIRVTNPTKLTSRFKRTLGLSEVLFDFLGLWFEPIWIGVLGGRGFGPSLTARFECRGDTIGIGYPLCL